MVYCFGTVCWGGYLERYIDIFVTNYITIFRGLLSTGVNYEDIADPRIVYVAGEDTPGPVTEAVAKKLWKITGKKLTLICDKHKYSPDTIMYSTRNRLRVETKKAYPNEPKVYFYFPIDDNVRPEAVTELYKLAHTPEPSACLFKFMVQEGDLHYSAGTRPICSWKDIHPEDWGGYCAYNILNEEACPLYPEIAIPNVAFYVELYKAGYKEYQSSHICIDHLRHKDSHHFKTKDTEMTNHIKEYLLEMKEELKKKGYK